MDERKEAMPEMPANQEQQGAAQTDVEERPLEDIHDDVIAMLKTCYDPEIPVDIYELGLIYRIRISPEREVNVDMTLTSPNCPVAQSLPQEVEVKVRSVPGVASGKVTVVWEPPWGPERMSEAARLELGFF